MRTAALFAAGALALAASTAHADTRAWTAAKAALPADTKIVVGIDVTAIQKTQLWAATAPKLMAKLDSSGTVGKLKAACNLDPMTAIQSVVVASSGDSSTGAVYIATTGVDQAKLASCVEAIAQGGGAEKKKVAVARAGDITSIDDGAQTYYVGWIGKDVLVMPSKAIDKAMLQTWMGGKGAFGKTDTGRALARVNTGAAVWGLGNVTHEIHTGMTMRLGYGTFDFAKGTLNADIHAAMQGGPDAAAAMAKEASDQLAQAKQGGMGPFGDILQGVTVTAVKDEVVVRASVAEKSLAALATLALAGM